MSLALLIDMVLHEFPDEGGSRKFRDRPEWRALVRRQEKLVLHPFYEKCIEIIADKHGRKKTLADERRKGVGSLFLTVMHVY
jgi:hypothetical protein